MRCRLSSISDFSLSSVLDKHIISNQIDMIVPNSSMKSRHLITSSASSDEYKSLLSDPVVLLFHQIGLVSE